MNIFAALFIGLVVLSPLAVHAQEKTDITHEGKTFRAPSGLNAATEAVVVNVDAASAAHATIIVRYLGYTCSHCVRQILYLQESSKKLRQLGVRVIAISEDPVERWNDLSTKYGLDTELFRYVADADGAIARSIGALRVENDSILDLHATIVRSGSKITYATFTTEPDMDIARIVGAVPVPVEAAPEAVVPEYIDRYLAQQPTSTIIAGPNDGVVEPLDLDFNRSYLHPNDLWVVTADKRGHAMTIIHEATSDKPVIVRKKDSRASHFMWRTMALSMGDNGAFGTAQNGEPGDGDTEYMFMGPTLWSSDTAVFASRYQNDDKYLASHLDMLHQSPYDLGIAHDSANVYWVSDAKYLGISRYDFRDPHEVGGTDHRDGVIRRYVETQIKAGERGRPAHIALDKSTGYLYYVDPGNGAVHCLDTKSGKVADTLKMPESSSEGLEEFTSVTGADFWTVVQGLARPIGIDVVGKRLLVGDAQTARIHVYAIDGKTVTSMGYIQTPALSLHGIVVGPDQRIWYVDKTAGTVCKLDLAAQNTLSAPRRVVVGKQRDSVSFTYTNASAATYQPAFQTRIWTAATNAWSSWSSKTYGPKIAPGTSEPLVAAISAPDSTTSYIIEIAEVGGNNVAGLTARCIVVPERTRKVIVSDERYGTFDIHDAVLQTSRKGYTILSSDIFVEIAHQLPYLKTILWNSGTAGEISVVDDAVLRSCSEKNIDVMLIADDPLLLRTDMPQSVQFFREFGASMRGVQLPENDNGMRRYTGVLADPVTAGMATIECELPRLNHHRGVKYLPSVLFNISGGAPMMRNALDSGYVGVRYQRGTYRSIILGINASRFLDGFQRTVILDKGLTWLEGAADNDPIDTTTSVDEPTISSNASIRLSAYASGRTLHWSVVRESMANMTVELYASTGQKITEIYAGAQPNPTGTIELQHVSSGCYHIIVRSDELILHRPIIIQ